MKSLGGLVVLVLFLIAAPGPAVGQEVTVASKTFTESVVLGELLSALIRDSGAASRRRRELGGTRILWSALLSGEIDVYPEYTGTISQEILAGENLKTEPEVRAALKKRGVLMSRPLGFNNTYAMGMKKETAGRLGIRTISDLRKHPELKFGFSNEFMDRGDGWPSLKARYRLPQLSVRGLDHNLAYRALEGGDIHLIDLYATDADIKYYDLFTLGDDLNFFPRYDAVILYRADLKKRAPKAVRSFLRLGGRIGEGPMIRMNARAKIDKVAESRVASEFLADAFGVVSKSRVISPWRRLMRNARDHLYLVVISLLAAILVSIPLGIWAARSPLAGQVILGVVGIIQTIPSLALLVFMIPLLGIGGPPAMMALFLYSLLPIVRNTYAGLHDIPVGLRESAEALGLPVRARLRLVELPLASRAILAGVKTSAVINVGTATLGALIGAGGFGQPILTGIRLDDVGLILEGAVPAAGLALLVQGGFDLLERFLVSEGLRLKPMP
ncbi:MAG: ABC transporter permease subunit [Nitrospinaceae bacterium]|nr:ABC transporter permease subunit [Nitrospinaceae bacterium]